MILISYIKFIFWQLSKFINFIVICIFFITLVFPILIVIKYIKKFKFRKKPKPALFWGPVPIINNKYYAHAMKKHGFISDTIMENYFKVINQKSDYDYTYEEYVPTIIQKLDKYIYTIKYFYIFIKIVKNYDVFHFSFLGGPLKDTFFKYLEAQLIHICGGKIIVLGYGADFYVYSRVLNKSWTHTLNVHYPYYAIHEEVVQKQVKYWTRHADIIINGMQIDGLGRWDVLPFRAECIEVDAWKKKTPYSMNDGKNRPVVVVHAPNHRFIKGTDYLIQSIDELKSEGLQVELILIEKKQNTEVKKILEEKADIFFDQLILGYAMSAIEAFSVGLPVITNLENDDYVKVFRRYSYLNECPAMSASHETLTDVLRILVTNPGLRKELGEAGRKYAEKYHSFHTAQELFTRIYDKIWYGKDVGNLNLYYHPLLPDSYNNRYPKVQHPLKENKYLL